MDIVWPGRACVNEFANTKHAHSSYICHKMFILISVLCGVGGKCICMYINYYESFFYAAYRSNRDPVVVAIGRVVKIL